MEQRVSECWEQLTDFIVFRNSVDIGALSSLQNILLDDQAFDPKTFADQFVTFLNAVNASFKTVAHNQPQLLGILSVLSLLNNLYLDSKNGQNFQSNTSTFYGWMSSSQMSIDHSNISERQGQVGPELIATLASSQSFFKTLKCSIQTSRSQEKTKRYVQSLLDFIDFVLGKEKLSRESFLRLRGKYVGLQSRRKWEISYIPANGIIFSAQLDKIVVILASGGDGVHSALLRIYLGWKEESRIFENAKFSGEEMLTNLYRYYISSFKDPEQLFQEGKHPLLRLLKNHLALLFTPSLRKFHQIVVTVALRCGNEPGYAFYKNGNSYLQSQFGDFINELPNQLVKLLSLLKSLVEEQHPGQPQFALSAVKKLFFYTFLLNQTLLQELYPQHDPSKWSLAYNHIINLFFHTSIKKYVSLPQNQLNSIIQIIEKLAGKIDNRISNNQTRIDPEENLNFRIKDTLLNHDYQLVLEVLSSLEFTPKDSKQFDMKKINNVAPESPVYKHLKGNTAKSEDLEGELELATWMSVGGSREWGSRPTKTKARGVAQRLKGFKTISLKTRCELLQQSEQLRHYLKG